LELLSDVVYSNFCIINESNDNAPKRKGVLKTVQAPFALAEDASIGDGVDENRNSRLYSRKLIQKKIVESDYTKEMLKNKTLYGEVGHPNGRFNISILDASHCITELKMGKDGVLYGKADILDTPSGRVIDTLIEYGSRIGVSCRAAGTTTKEGDKIRVNEDDYVYFTHDFVPDPGFASSRITSVSEGSVDREKLASLVADLEEKINKENPEDLSNVKTLIESLNNKIFDGLLETIDRRMKVDDKLARENALLQEKVNELESRLESKDNTNPDNTIDINSINSFGLEDEIQILECEKRSLENKNKELEALAKSLDHRLKNQQPIKESKSEDNKAEEAQIKELDEENQSLKDKVLELQEITNEKNRIIENLKAEISLTNLTKTLVESNKRESSKPKPIKKKINVQPIQENISAQVVDDSSEDLKEISRLEKLVRKANY
jgi:hypothetical protein